MKIELILEYDGGAFSGWQRQPDVLSVQQELEQSLLLYLESIARKHATEVEPVTITASGRTDAGVHARGQVASFPWPPQLPLDLLELRDALNGISSSAISVRYAHQAADCFDARRTPHEKAYSYSFLCRRASGGLYGSRAWHLPYQLDVTAMIHAARQFEGTHDFKSFQASDCAAKTTTRTIHHCELSRRDSELLLLFVRGNGFLKQMIRCIAGTLFEVGKGSLAANEIGRLIAAKDRRQAGQTAPAHGLCLEWVRYIDRPIGRF